MTTAPVQVLARLTRALESLGIPYVVGGSFASSVYGTPRSTQDADVIADIAFEKVDALVRLLGDEFFADAGAMRAAVRECSSFNLLHVATMFKVDVFISPDDDWSRMRLTRARREVLETTEGPVEIRFSSPEDTVLHKLVWFKLGNEVSDRQWSDVLGLLRVQGTAVDATYLDRWAPVLGVAELLTRARRDARRAGS